MNHLVCIDDTDMPGTKGTGWLVEALCRELDAKGFGAASVISRHQLFVHDDIPFTSHNSSMCFEIALKKSAKELVDFLADALKVRSRKGSDPGLCVGSVPEAPGRTHLIEFGRQAKRRVLSKEMAYDLAASVGVHLSEHGGTGDGVVGALAGLGLRLSGNDGRYRGWHHLGQPGDVVKVERLCRYPFIDALVNLKGDPLPPEAQVCIGSEKTKTVRIRHSQVVVVTANESADRTGIPFRTITKEEAKAY